MALAVKLDLKPVTGTLGAEVRGVDLASVDEDTCAAIRNALLEHLVLFFRDQDLTPEQHRDFGLRFGALQVHPNYPAHERVREVLPIPSKKPAIQPVPEPARRHRDLSALRWSGDGTWVTAGADQWHTDMTFLEQPPMGSILYCREAPAAGGDTMWANQYAAYETLSEGMKRLVDELVAVHGDALQKREIEERGGDRPDSPPRATRHPVVRMHPDTGRKALFVNPYFTERIEGVPRGESRGLLDFLYQHSVEPEFCCRFRWEKGSIAFWDNRCTMHCAIDDYGGQRREMHRITIEGDRPK